MSIEKELKLAYQEGEAVRGPSRALDERIAAAASARMRGRENRVPRRRTRPRVRSAAILVGLMLISGVAYASTYLYSLQTSQVRMTLSGELTLPEGAAARVGSQLEAVRRQLAPGEAAFVYSTELEKWKLPPLTKVTNPVPIPDLAEWKERTLPVYGPLKTPAALPTGWQLVRGELETAYQGYSPEDSERVLPGLKKRAKAEGSGYAWEKAAESGTYPLLPTPGLVIRTQTGEDVQIRYIVFREEDGVFRVEGKQDKKAVAEQVRIGERDAVYTESPNYLLSQTGTYREVVWMEEQEGRTVVYQVGAEDPAVGKDTLLEIASRLQ
ncbi:hypothetical protein J31TS4_13280 [Paenibacillus sp. J31TS4]|uniref:hypothetical protein n=1 Tax=Paenibacillus sp. J31TS4 TaxID=2807195 RepID=UPI001B26A36D|nr:hypothetical protein [Paenibacillus sp. J31TS4]GIP38048.1 hypothetical protein J31TS4_13280 [Paenibacillus sp. J31TS4]